MNSHSSSATPRSRLSGLRGCLGGIVGLVIILFLVFFVTTGLDAVSAPWAYPILGHPTLTGHWTGTVTMPSGIRFALYMEIERTAGSSTDESKALEYISGRASWCDNHGRHMENAPLDGTVPSFSGYSGNADNVNLSISMEKSPPLGLLPNNFHGKWDGDTLTLTSDFSNNTGNGFEYSDSNPDQSHPVTFTMQKGKVETFQADCAQAQ